MQVAYSHPQRIARFKVGQGHEDMLVLVSRLAAPMQHCDHSWTSEGLHEVCSALKEVVSQQFADVCDFLEGHGAGYSSPCADRV